MLMTQQDYQLYSNSNWPSLEAIYTQLVAENHMNNMLSDVDRHFFLKAINERCSGYAYRNRDFRHMSKMSNSMVADYFFDKIDSKFIKHR
jgi:hypothetical protein